MGNYPEKDYRRAQTYTLNYYKNTTDTVTNMPEPNPQTETSSTGTVTFNIPTTKPTREGYNFLGWHGKPDATEPTVKPGNTVTTTATVTKLYAVWESKTPPTDKPDKPDMKNFLGNVLIRCKTDGSTHAEKGRKDIYSNTRDSSMYTEVLDGNGDAIWKDNGGVWTYQIKLIRAKFVEAYSNNRFIKYPHTDTAPNEETILTWKYKNGAWELIKLPGYTEVATIIEVKCAETPVKPEKPTALDGSFAIVCKNNKATHPYKADYIATPSQYTISDVQKDEQGYYVTATVTVAPNLVAYNKATRVEHRLVDEQDATLTITFRYDTEATVDGNRKWKQQGDLPVVEVICKPKAPTADELKKLEMAVQVKCVVDASQQHTAAYGLLGECDVDYFVFEPRQEGDDWLCDISYYPERYVAEFNTTFQNLKHVQNDEKIVPVTLIWAGGSWQIKTQGRVHVTEEYTVTYTDGVDGEEVFADQVYSDLRKDSTTPAFNGTPTRTGYTFAGWEPEVAATVTQTVTYVAKWEAKKANVHLMIFKSGDLSKPIVDVPYAADKLAGDTIDLTKIDPSSYLDFDFEIDGGWYDDGMFNSYKRYLDGLQDKPAGLEKLLITGNWQNLKLIVTELVPVVYFDSLESLTAYQNDHSKTGGHPPYHQGPRWLGSAHRRRAHRDPRRLHLHLLEP
ncbi:MAG: InlB B-repeat-containing protein [Oscillospiraceae bacterium]